MRTAIGLAISALLTMSALSASAEDAPRPLKDGDRIVFLGDSITQGGAGPKGYVTMVRKALEKKHPEWKLEVIGAGISGNKVPDLQRRVERDVISKNPTLVVIYIGINDVWHGEKNPERGTMPAAFESGLKEVIGKCTAAGAQVVLCTPSVIGEKKAGANSLDAKLDQYSDLSRKLAGELKLGLCDLRKAFLDHIQTHNPEDQERGILTNDRVHLNEAGNAFVAEEILKVIDP